MAQDAVIFVAPISKLTVTYSFRHYRHGRDMDLERFAVYSDDLGDNYSCNILCVSIPSHDHKLSTQRAWYRIVLC